MRSAMRMTGRAIILAAWIGAVAGLPAPVAAATHTVNTTDDRTDGGCDAVHCSLREAVEAANYNGVPDTIRFDIPGPGPHVISLSNPITILYGPLTIAGDSEPDYDGTPVVAVTGAEYGSHGIVVIADGVTIRGLSLIEFRGTRGSIRTPIMMQAGRGTLLENNWIGVAPGGAAAGNSAGVVVSGEGIQILGNVISGNGFGIRVEHAYGLSVQGNLIGTDPTGSLAVGNETGIWLEPEVRSALIGGDDPSLRNVISGSAHYGIYDLSEGGDGEIVGNYIGTNAEGSAAIPNLFGIYRPGWASGSQSIRGNLVSGNQYGIHIGGGAHRLIGNTVGANAAGTAGLGNVSVGLGLQGCHRCLVRDNLISGNSVGVDIRPSSSGGGSPGNRVLHNQIGTDRTGTIAIPNGIGVQVSNSHETEIGADEPDEANLISGNRYGIVLSTDSAWIRGNRIGTDASGTSPLPNQVGILLNRGGEGVAIEGAMGGGGNIVAYNTSNGITSEGAAGFEVESNSIHHNGGHGIYLQAGPSTPPGGAGIRISINEIYENALRGIRVDNPDLNGGLLAPTLSSGTRAGVSGYACAGCRVEVFEAAPDPTGHGEGQTLLGWNIAGDDGRFSVSFPRRSTCGPYTATAIDPAGNTTEFSRNFASCIELASFLAVAIILIPSGAGSALFVVIRRAPLAIRAGQGLLGGILGALLGFGLLQLPMVAIQRSPQAQEIPITPTMAAAPALVTPQSLPPTSEPSPTATAEPTVTPTPSPTPQEEPEALFLQNANCREGPALVYDIVTSLYQGQTARVDGRNVEGTWWWIQLPGLQAHCWVAGSTVQVSGDTFSVTVYEAPPTPVAACWVWDPQIQQNVCTSPCPPNAQPGGACTP